MNPKSAIVLLLSATILSLGYVAASFLSVPRYDMVRMDENLAFRLDRWTGETTACAEHEDGQVGCVPVRAVYPGGWEYIDEEKVPPSGTPSTTATGQGKTK